MSFYLNHDWAKQRGAFQTGKNPSIDRIRLSQRMTTRSKLGKPCCICGKTAQDGRIEMHHVRHIRKLSDKREARGFNRILRKLNRKQIPVCEACHDKDTEENTMVSNYHNWHTFRSSALVSLAGEPGEKPDASKGCTSGSVGRGWCSWETKTWPLTRHHSLYRTISNHYLAPISPETRSILDVGTGTGIWPLEMATLFPRRRFWAWMWR